MRNIYQLLNIIIDHKPDEIKGLCRIVHDCFIENKIDYIEKTIIYDYLKINLPNRMDDSVYCWPLTIDGNLERYDWLYKEIEKNVQTEIYISRGRDFTEWT